MKTSLLFLATICLLHLASGQTTCTGPNLMGPDSDFYFMEVDFVKTREVSKLVEKAAEVFKDTDGEEGKLIWLFKVVGESRVLAVVENTPEPFWKALTEEIGEYVTITSTPLRPYEHLAHGVNGVDQTLTGPSPRVLEPNPAAFEKLYFVDGFVNYKGFTLEEALAAWRLENLMVLQARAAGVMQIDAFKVVGSNRVLNFLVGHPDATDDLTFQLPMVKALGDNLQLPLKEITPL